MKRCPQGGIRPNRGGWEVRLMVNGQTYYERLPGTATRRDAEISLAALVEAVASGSADLTVRGALERYVSAKQGGWSPSTQQTQPFHVQAIVDALGSQVLHSLKPAAIQDAYDAWIADEVSPWRARRGASKFPGFLWQATTPDRIASQCKARLTSCRVPAADLALRAGSHPNPAGLLALLGQTQEHTDHRFCCIPWPAPPDNKPER